MKQLLQNMRDGKTTVEDVPVPAVRAGMALVRTAASLVSAGTERMVVEFARESLVGKAIRRPDLVKQVVDKALREGLVNTAQAAFNRLDQPMALGYSSAGTIVALGTGMTGFRVGQRVACAGAGFAVHAEYAVVPRNLLVALPAEVDFESAAFSTLAAVGMHGFRLAQPQLGERVAVIGLGLLGLMTAQIAAAAGCQALGVDVDAARVKLAGSLGIAAASRGSAESAAQAFTASRGFDVILICADTASNDPVELAAHIARDRARVVAVGAVGQELPRRGYYEKEISFINSRSYGPGRYDPSYEERGNDYPIGQVRWTEGRNIESVVALMAAGKLEVEPLITHRFAIEDAAFAYDLITGKKRQPFLGVLLTYPEHPEPPSTRVEFPAAKASPQKVRLGVIGAGNFANATLLPAIQRAGRTDLVGIVSAGGLHAQHAARKFGFAFASSSVDELLADKNVNTVAILTRHNTHADLALKAMKAGKNVFVEKPLAVDLAQLRSIEKVLAKPNSPMLTVGFNRRFSPFAASLSSFFSDSAEPMHIHYRVNAGLIPADHWTQTLEGGGRLIGEACHFVDLMTHLVGAAPVSVSAHALPDAGKYREDNASMTFSFPDGSLGVVDYLANGDRSVSKERMEVFCGSKVAIMEDFRSLDLVANGRRKMSRIVQDKGWDGEWKAFAGAIEAGGPAPIPYDQLIGVTRAMIAAVESIRTGQSVSF